jgi:repressor LexA
MTPRTRDLITALQALSRDGASPSYQELAAALGLSSRACVHRLVRQAEREGVIERLPGRARTLRLIPPSPAEADLSRLPDPALGDLHARILAELDRRGGLHIRTNKELIP